MQEHVELVQRLTKPGQAILNELTAADCNKLHMAVGLAGEVGELLEARDRAHEIEELGDLEFFYQGLLLAYGLPDIAKATASSHNVITLVSRACDILDYVKRETIYRKAKGDIAELLGEYRSNYLAILRYRDIALPVVQTANIDKLTLRYGHTYTNTAAQERADKAQAAAPTNS